MFDDIELTIDETIPYTTYTAQVPTNVEPTVSALTPIYLTVRQIEKPNDPDVYEFQTSALTSGNKATVLVGKKQCGKTELFNLLTKLESVSKINIDDFGNDLVGMIFDAQFRDLLDDERFAGHPLVIVHDIASSSIPWETVRLCNAAPALKTGITRQYMAENMTIAKWLETRRIGPTLDILLVVNPTGDLPGAKVESESLGQELRRLPRVRVTIIEGSEATKARLLNEFKSGEYDVIHYAGHAEFNPLDRGRSGIKCAGNEILGGEDLVSLANLPALVFFNACESGRLLFSEEVPENDAGQNRAGFAEAFLRGGVANFIGTYWPVHDDSATAFSREFYRGIVNGDSLGDSLLKGRVAVQELGGKAPNDWADYMLYGSPEFRLKDVS
jgi:hypothetical protein